MTASRRIMLLGAAGQVGQAIRHQTLPQSWQLGLYSRNELDITDASALRDAVQTFQPDLIINSAGMTNVDKSEQDPDAAMAANFTAPATLAAQASALDIPLIHLSTDYVFDGDHDTPYLPDDPMNPVNAYGRSKLMGEEAVRHELAWHVILRISSVFSAFNRNILTNTLKMIDERDELRMVTDQLGAPTPATDVASAIIKIAESLLNGKSGGFGTFHLCGAPSCTRYELTEAIMAAYAPFTTHRPKITPTVSAEYANLAPRPRYSVMDCAKTEAVYGIAQRPWQLGLDAAMRQLFEKRSAAT
jgi:dTDP-4-dehydrorhamnose reductase